MPFERTRQVIQLSVLVIINVTLPCKGGGLQKVMSSYRLEPELEGVSGTFSRRHIALGTPHPFAIQPRSDTHRTARLITGARGVVMILVRRLQR